MIPFERLKVTGLSEDEHDVLNELMQLWRDKLKRNKLRAGFYDMKNATRHLMSSNVPDVVKKRAFALGWSATAVDKLNRRCNLEGFYEANGLDMADFGLTEIVEDNRLYDELSQAGISSLIHTPSWIITTQGDTDAGEPDVLMTMRDALTGAGAWDGRLRQTKHYMSLNEFDETGNPTRLTLFLRNLNITCAHGTGGWKVTDRREHVYGVPVDPLRYRPRLNRPLGSSRISRSVMSIHSQALSAMIRADVNGEAYSLSRYVLLGATESAFQNADGTPKPTWKAAWDAVWAIGDDEEAEQGKERASIQQFHGQSPEPQNAHLRMLAQMFSGETGIPLGELGVTGDSNPTSWQAMETSREDIIAEAYQVTRTWSPDIARAVRRALEMKNRGDVPADLRPVPHFRKPQHVSPASAADAGTKIVGQLPWLKESEVGLELMGLDPDQRARAMNDLRRQQATRSLREVLTAGTATTSTATVDGDAAAATS